ncbi:MAG: hypothetical protein EAZ57_05015 [Cytophagales bacterium]|nr:MAG: hypothetical protein EAZ67_00865 [Cytophagales bacterium]TAF61152.1 MAG: hypothetical protein EAZ57_05015 [Cytophagales bacterium]
MTNNKITQLYYQFKEETGSKLQENQFKTFVTFFPALLVVMADGQIDEDEWFYIENLAEFMARAHFDDSPSQDLRHEYTEMFLGELRHTLEKLNGWEPLFLDALAEYLTIHPEYKEDIVELLEVFAESSEGISSTEQQKMDSISALLQLND